MDALKRHVSVFLSSHFGQFWYFSETVCKFCCIIVFVWTENCVACILSIVFCYCLSKPVKAVGTASTMITARLKFFVSRELDGKKIRINKFTVIEGDPLFRRRLYLHTAPSLHLCPGAVQLAFYCLTTLKGALQHLFSKRRMHWSEHNAFPNVFPQEFFGRT